MGVAKALQRLPGGKGYFAATELILPEDLRETARKLARDGS